MFKVLPYLSIIQNYYLYSDQLLIAMSSIDMLQNALMKALANRLFVMSGTLRSMAARRIL